MTPDMAFECLLVSRDPAICSTFSTVLRDFSVHSDHCLTSERAPQLLAKGSHDLIVIDWEGQASLDALQEIRRMKRKPTVMAISAADCAMPGVHVALRKPLTQESAKAYFRVAYSRMLIDHRQRARYAVMTSVTAQDEKHRPIPLTVTDIGEGGIGISCKEPLTVGDVLFFHLPLVGARKPICVEARILWTREYGAAGCQFLRIPPVDMDILREWLRQKFRVKTPAHTD
jgi:PilZ domain